MRSSDWWNPDQCWSHHWVARWWNPPRVQEVLGSQSPKKQISFSLARFNCTMNTLRSFWCHGCVQTEALLGNHKNKSAPLFRLLWTETIDVPKKRSIVRVTYIQKEKAEKDKSKQTKLFQHSMSMSIAQQLVPIYNITVHKN